MGFAICLRHYGRRIESEDGKLVDAIVISSSDTTSLPVPSVGERVVTDRGSREWNVVRRTFEYGYTPAPETDDSVADVTVTLWVSAIRHRPMRRSVPKKKPRSKGRRT